MLLLIFPAKADDDEAYLDVGDNASASGKSKLLGPAYRTRKKLRAGTICPKFPMNIAA